MKMSTRLAGLARQHGDFTLVMGMGMGQIFDGGLDAALAEQRMAPYQRGRQGAAALA